MCLPGTISNCFMFMASRNAFVLSNARYNIIEMTSYILSDAHYRSGGDF
jgi:hypothetical protein